MAGRLLAALLLVCMLLPVAAGCGGGKEEEKETEKESGPPQTVEISADGADDFRTFQDAIAEVADGGTIELGAGIYDLGDRPPAISKSLSLVGEGRKTTEIRGSGGAKALISVEGGDRSFSAEGISFARTGGTEGGVLLVDAEEVQLTRCRFSGASSGNESQPFAAIVIMGETKGRVGACVATKSDSGIFVLDQSTVTLEGNTCTANRQDGIVVWGDARPLIRSNTCNENGGVGILAMDSAQAVVESNECARNLDGIVVANKVQATIAGNRLTDNESTGIQVSGTARCTVRDNRCAGNVEGIWIRGDAHATVEDNVCLSNQAGIHADDRATVTLRRNTCDNEGQPNNGGIFIGGSAQATVVDNSCEGNTDYGIHFADNASGSVTGNYCARSRFGIVVLGKADPKISGNRFESISQQNVVMTR